MQLSQDLYTRLAQGMGVAPASDAATAARTGGAAEQRVRFPLGQRAQLWPGRGPETGPCQTAMLRELSATGVVLLSDVAMSAGDPLVVRLTPAAAAPVFLRCTVSQSEAGGFGCAAHVVSARFDGTVEDFVPAASGAGTVECRDLNRRSRVIAAVARCTARIRRALDPRRLSVPWGPRRDDFSSI